MKVRRGGRTCGLLASAAALALTGPLLAQAGGDLSAREGRLVADHLARHPDLAPGSLPLEPMAPRGRWTRSPAGTPVWAPEWLDRSHLLEAALHEVDHTAPEADPRIAPGTRGPDPDRPPRVVIMDPGAFSYAVEGGPGPLRSTGLTRGMIAFAAWPRPAGPAQDVVWVAWRLEGEPSRPLLPALAHALRLHRTRDGLNEPDGAQPYTP